MEPNSPNLLPPAVGAEISRIEDTLLRFVSSRLWEIRTITFPTVVGQSVDITHRLNPPRPEFIDWVILQSVQPCIVYQPVNNPFRDGIIHLACTQPGASVTLLLMVSGEVPGRSPLLGTALDTTLTSTPTNRFAIGGAGRSVILNEFGGSSTALDSWRSASIKFDTSSIDWELGVDDSGSGNDNAFVFFDATNDIVPVQIHLVSGAYYLSPTANAGAITTVSLGRDASGERWDDVFTQNGLKEQGRSHYAGHWITYTPTWTGSTTNPTLGNATLSGKYTIIGTTVHFRIALTIGSTTTPATGIWSFAIPQTLAASGLTGGSGFIQNIGTTTDSIVPILLTTTTTGAIHTPTPNGLISDVVPFTFATGDTFNLVGTYEMA